MVSVTDGAVALRRLADVDPDVLITDVYLPTQNAFELARFVRAQPQYNYLKIIFAAAPADEFNEQDARNAGADAILRKPFEASTLLSTVTRLAEESKSTRQKSPAAQPALDRETVRAAVTLALDRAMPLLIEELTERVILSLAHIQKR